MRWPKKVVVGGEPWTRGAPFPTPYGTRGYVYKNSHYLPLHIPPAVAKSETDLTDWIYLMRTPTHH